MQQLAIQAEPQEKSVARSPDSPIVSVQPSLTSDKACSRTTSPKIDSDMLYAPDKLLEIFKKKSQIIHGIEKGSIKPDSAVQLEFAELEADFLTAAFELDHLYHERFSRLVFPEAYPNLTPSESPKLDSSKLTEESNAGS